MAGGPHFHVTSDIPSGPATLTPEALSPALHFGHKFPELPVTFVCCRAVASRSPRVLRLNSKHRITCPAPRRELAAAVVFDIPVPKRVTWLREVTGAQRP